MGEICSAIENQSPLGIFMKPHHVEYRHGTGAFFVLYQLRHLSEEEQRQKIAELVKNAIKDPISGYDAFGGIRDVIGDTPEQRAVYEEGLLKLAHTIHNLHAETDIRIRADANDPICALSIKVGEGNHCRRYQKNMYERLGEYGATEELYTNLHWFGPVRRIPSKTHILTLVVKWKQIQAYWESEETFGKIAAMKRELRIHKLGME